MTTQISSNEIHDLPDDALLSHGDIDQVGGVIFGKVDCCDSFIDDIQQHLKQELQLIETCHGGEIYKHFVTKEARHAVDLDDLKSEQILESWAEHDIFENPPEDVIAFTRMYGHEAYFCETSIAEDMHYELIDELFPIDRFPVLFIDFKVKEIRGTWKLS